MQKIISLFQRNYEGDRQVRDEIVPGAEWVVAGAGVATRKWDGTCVMVRDGTLYKRYDAKHGKTPPADFEPAMEPDPITGHWAGWVPVDVFATAGPDKWHAETWRHHNLGLGIKYPDGTYELVGPHFQTNPEGYGVDTFIRHGAEVLPDAPRDFAGIRAYLAERAIEGIVWHHPDGRMVKIKARDFGLTWARA